LGKNSKKSKGSKSDKTPYYSRFESVSAFVPEDTVSTDEVMSGVKILPIYKLKNVPVLNKILSLGKLKYFLHEKIDLERLTGIRSRHQCSKDEDSYTMALAAANKCLKYSSYKAEDLDIIINCSISKFKGGLTYVYEPPLSVFLKDALGAPQALNFDISNACAGMMTGVFILDDMIKRGAVKRGMVVSGEYTTYLYKNAAPKVKTIASEELASLTTGDGAAAVIMERSADNKPSMRVSDFTTLAGYSDLCFGKAGKDNPGACMTTKAQKIHKVAIANAPKVMERALEGSGLTYDQMDYVIPHQTSKRAIEVGGKHLADYFGVEPKRIVNNLEEYANTASTTHFIAMYKMLKQKVFKKGEKVMLLVFASGLVVGVVIFTMDDLVDKYGGSS